jgi:putative protein kinase ArgK-like GTPase of G3E family
VQAIKAGTLEIADVLAVSKGDLPLADRTERELNEMLCEGDVLTARSTEVSRTKNLAIYRVDVTRDDGTMVSAFTGTVFLTKRSHAPHLTP